MAIMDALAYFSDAQALASVSSGDEDDSTYCVDLTGGNKAKDGFGTSISDLLGGAGTVYFNAKVTTVLDCTGATVLHARLRAHSATSTFKSGNVVAELQFPVDAAAGTVRSAVISPMKIASTERYLGVGWAGVGGTKVVTGSVEAWLSDSPPDTQIGGTNVT